MAYQIEFSEDATRQLDRLKARNRVTILDSIVEQLTHQPTVPTRQRKLLQANPLADWELRVGNYRVFYTVAEEQVLVLVIAVGEKRRNVLLIEGVEVRL